MTRSHRTGLPAALAALLVFCLAAAASESLPPNLDRVLRDHERAWRTKDALALASLFAEDDTAAVRG